MSQTFFCTDCKKHLPLQSKQLYSATCNACAFRNQVEESKRKYWMAVVDILVRGFLIAATAAFIWSLL